MLTQSNSPKAGYVRLDQDDSFEDQVFNKNSPKSTKSKRSSRFSSALTEPRALYPHVTIELRPTTHMEPANENDALFSISAPERSATVEQVSPEEAESPNSLHSTWGNFSKKFKLKGKGKTRNVDSDIYISVFKPISALKDWQPSSTFLTSDHQNPLEKEQYDVIVESVKTAISSGMQPQRISQGSSGSYFCRNKEGKIVGVFKPKNEEPYGHLNPKWTKWIHRNLFPCFFGRSCLIPNLGYLSEAAASILDQRLRLNIVPVTKVVWLSSPSFHYDYLDRVAARSKKNPKPLPEKIGSFQVFLEGFKDANVFLRDHPWPENLNHNVTTTSSDHDLGGYERQNQSRLNALMCRGNNGNEDDRDLEESYPLGRRFAWTPSLQEQFREQFEKLVILDYLMRNTDRGADNWMIKYCEQEESIRIAVTPPKPTNMMMKPTENMNCTNVNISPHSTTVENDESVVTLKTVTPDFANVSSGSGLAENQSSISSRHTSDSPSKISYPHVHVAAIDNGLAFPFKHPDSWRSYPYGWVYLPQSLVGRPFTVNTRNHFLSLLTSPRWWKETVNTLRQVFELDADFDEGMFKKQISVLKGQGWNIVETLSQYDQGPLDLVSRQNVLVLDEETYIDESDDRALSDDYGIYNQGYSASFPMNPENGEPSSARLLDSSKSRRSISEDNISIQRPTAVAGNPTVNTPATMGQKWAAKIKNKFNLDSIRGKDLDDGRQKKRVIVEQLETVKGAVPFFSCC
ncbi:hypothetical protein G9A89_010385 [Geosiphon pyriformis]|nr:hypothetical protein G9A89_010385 [Geosiphon pyriformis]